MISGLGGITGGISGAANLGAGAGAGAAGATSAGGNSFSELLSGLNNATAGADRSVEGLATGADGDLHDAMLSVEMESLAFDLAVQIRNRLVEAYSEVFRMQV